VNYSSALRFGPTMPTCAAQPCALTQAALVALGAVNQTCCFIARGAVIGGESISLRASAVINQRAVFFTREDFDPAGNQRTARPACTLAGDRPFSLSLVPTGKRNLVEWGGTAAERRNRGSCKHGFTFQANCLTVSERVFEIRLK
jgi:hypothetical protein